jgi:formate-dependent nitrite reductase membrane component NrfD
VNVEINPYVADPDWGVLIVLYFFFGGIAAGSYVMAALADLFGDADDRRGVRVAYYLAFPLVSLCGLLLTADLGRPERFWHMIFQSNTGWPMLKWWSPMSIGSWGLSAFAFFSFFSFVGVLAEDGWFGLRRFSPLAAGLRNGLTGRLFALGGGLSAFFLGSYTGVLLGATNQPIWSNTTWTGALFLASAVSTGVATIVLVDRWLKLDVGADVFHRLENLDAWAMVMELILLATLLLSLGQLAVPAMRQWPGVLLPTFVLPVGLVAPLALKRLRGARIATLNCVLVLAGGFVLRAAIVGMPAPLLLAHHH